MNLVTNAYHAIGDTAGRIDIETTVVTIDRVAADHHEDLTPGRYIQLTVADTGPGIAGKHLARIFEPYYTTKEVDVGTGMGLATVHGIVKEHDGAISVESLPGEGASFAVLLPLTEVSIQAEPAEIATVPEGRERILFVDDELMLAESARDLLAELGYAVTSHTDPARAWEQFRFEPEAFDLVITDLTMPAITGDVLAGDIKQLRPDIPIILCSGFSKKLAGRELADMHVDCILNKPIVFEELATTIRSILDKAP
jgi:CheY-like chemotaxis protein